MPTGCAARSRASIDFMPERSRRVASVPVISGKARFGAVVMDEQHLAAALRYVSLNPVRARLVARAQDWRWSSTRAHVRGDSDSALSSLVVACWRASPTPTIHATSFAYDGFDRLATGDNHERTARSYSESYGGRKCALNASAANPTVGVLEEWRASRRRQLLYAKP